MTVRGPDVPQPTLARELEQLSASALALWLAEALPSGPTLLWACGPEIGHLLAQDQCREVVLLEPREAEAEVAMRRGAGGLRVLHVPVRGAAPDLSDLGMRDFSAAVVVDGPGPVDGVVASILDLLLPDGLLVVVCDPQRAAAVTSALEGRGRASAVAAVDLAACARVSPGGSTPDDVRFVGDASRRDAHHLVVVSGGSQIELPSVLLVGAEQGLPLRARDLDQMSETIVALDRVVDQEHAARLAGLEAALADTQHQLVEARRALDDRTAALAAVHRSTSWRVTRPIRLMKDLLDRA